MGGTVRSRPEVEHKERAFGAFRQLSAMSGGYASAVQNMQAPDIADVFRLGC